MYVSFFNDINNCGKDVNCKDDEDVRNNYDDKDISIDNGVNKDRH